MDQSDWCIEPETCTKMLRDLTEKRGAKFPATTLSYSMVKTACHDVASPKFLNWKQAQ